MQIEFEELTTPESLEIVRNIAGRVWPQTFANILSAEQIRYMMNMMYSPQVMEKELQNGVHFEIIKIDSEPCGYISYSAYEDHPGVAKLHKVYLLPGFHSLGLGQAMLEEAQKKCREAGFDHILLTVNKHNERAIRAYRRNGFEITASVATPIGSGYFMDDYIMQKAL